jgi:outer membrane protein TolC
MIRSMELKYLVFRPSKGPLWLILAVTIAIYGFHPPSVNAESQPLTLSEAVDISLKENLAIRSEDYGVRISESSVTAEEGEFDSAFRIEVSHESSEKESPSTLTATEEDLLIADFSWGGRLRSGGTYELKLGNEHVDSNLGFLIENPYYRSELTFSFTQPVLKGFGRQIQESRLNIARNNAEISRLKLSETAVGVIAETVKEYWELHFAIGNLEVVKLSLELAESLQEEVKARITAGKLASIEIYQAEAEVALRQGNLILARKERDDREDRLKSSMGIIGWEPTISPVTDPPPPVKPPSLALTLKESLENRRDYRQAKIDLQNKGILKDYYDNQRRSELDIITSTGVNGVDGAYHGILDDMFSGDTLSWKVGLLYTRPFGNRVARGNYLRSGFEEDQSRTLLTALEQNIQLEVREAWRNLSTAVETIGSTTTTRIAAEKKLQAEEEKFKAGKSTLNDVLKFQEEYARSLSREKRARTDYMIALTEMERVKGTMDRELRSILVTD